MREFSLRNKSTNPILTLSPAMLKLMLAARPESNQLVLAKYIADYKRLTGKKVTLDYDQTQALNQLAKTDERGMWTSRYSGIPFGLYQIQTLFVDGYMNRTTSDGMVKDLELAQQFYDMLDLHLAALTNMEIEKK